MLIVDQQNRILCCSYVNTKLTLYDGAVQIKMNFVSLLFVLLVWEDPRLIVSDSTTESVTVSSDPS